MKDKINFTSPVDHLAWLVEESRDNLLFEEAIQILEDQKILLDNFATTVTSCRTIRTITFYDDSLIEAIAVLTYSPTDGLQLKDNR